MTKYTIRVGKNNGLSIQTERNGYVDEWNYFTNVRDFNRWFREKYPPAPKSTPGPKTASAGQKP